MPDNTRNQIIEVLEAVSKAQLRALRRLRQSTKMPLTTDAPETVKSMSHTNIVYDVLLRAGRPLHITEILDQVSQQHGLKLDRESVVSALSKRVARHDRFLRTAPNTFGLLPEIER